MKRNIFIVRLNLILQLGKRVKAETIDADTLDDEKELFSALKSKRMELARKRRVPAYIIFPDATLHQMLLISPKLLKKWEDLME